ncbi:MAG: efflux RND transporter periplasmic adaptor subunit [Burkholderiales bacterium]|nr:efflux RND transporter periplasmic adaptor subunit [Burkholderiales bacterium]
MPKPSRLAARAAPVALAGAILIAGCRPAPEPPPPEVRPVRTMTVMKLAAGQTVTLTGTVQAQTEVNYAFRIDGRMIERPVRVGDAIRPGQLLARLDASNEEAALASARAQLAAAEAVAVEQRNNLNRQRELLAQRFISQAAFDQIAANAKSAEASVVAARSQVELAQNRLSYTRLVADAPGTVAAVGAEPGEVVPAGRMIVQAARKAGVDAVFDVPAQIKDRAPANPEITVVLTGDPSVAAKGRVREVSPRADPVTGTFQVRVGLIDPPAGMRLGSTVTGSFRMDKAPAIEIPGSALVRAGPEPAVWIVDPRTQTVSQRPIRVASHDAERVVVAEGLEAGDVVVTAGVQALHTGQKVRLLGAAK